MYFIIQGALEARVYDADSLARLRHSEGMDAGLLLGEVRARAHALRCDVCVGCRPFVHGLIGLLACSL